MNKRIRDIAIQTDIWCDQNGAVKAAEWEEKFAELIVQECVNAAEEAQADFYVVNNIKSRFGLAEHQK